MSKRKKEEQRRSEQFQMQRMVRRYDLAKWTLPPLIWIASLWIPLQAVLPIAHELAGKDTTLTVSLTFTIVVSIAASGGVLLMFLRSRGQKAELQRLREIIEELEEERKGVVVP